MGLIEKSLDVIVDTLFGLNNVRGHFGESAVAESLGWVNFLGFRGKILRNVYIPKANGETSEIDLLYITKKGIVVIESKNYAGYIFGSEDSQHWTMTTYKGKDWLGRKQVAKNRFYNPIKQNRTHMKWLNEYLKDGTPLTSCIVFSNASELKDIQKESKDIYVCNRKDLTIVFMKIWNRLPDALNNEQIDTIYSKLQPLTLKQLDKSVKEQHIEQIKENENTLKCPNCGSELVLRTATKGPNQGKQFYGCSAFPKCRYTRQI